MHNNIHKNIFILVYKFLFKNKQYKNDIKNKWNI